MVRVLVVHAHPNRESLGAALRDAAIEGSRASCADVDLIDLYAEEFGLHVADDSLRAHVARLRSCDVLVLVYPTWWGAQPALLRSWFEQVWSHPHALGPGAPLRCSGERLANIRRLVTVTTHGSPKWINAVQGESGKHFLKRVVRPTLAPRARFDWLALYDLDHERPGVTHQFLARVREHLERSA